MANTKTSICNQALRLLGATRITDITDAVEQARILNDVYDAILDEVLVGHPWNFAIKRIDLGAELDETPEFGYTHAFQLPGDCLRIVKMEDDDAIFVRESDQLLTDEEVAKIQYIARITDATLYTPFFVSVLAARLASEIAYPITNSATASESMYKLYLSKLRTAKSVDAQEGSGQKLENLSWEEARGGGGSSNPSATPTPL